MPKDETWMWVVLGGIVVYLFRRDQKNQSLPATTPAPFPASNTTQGGQTNPHTTVSPPADSFWDIFDVGWN